MSNLYNHLSKEELELLRNNEGVYRQTVSFYRYVRIEEIEKFRADLYRFWFKNGVVGRVYVAHEGINAQISVPIENWDKFIDHLSSVEELKNMPLKIALEEKGTSFLKLIVRIKEKIVADGLADHEIDLSNMGRHLDPLEFDEMLEDPEAVVVDVRNHYESEVGHFDGAICPDVDTFKESLPIIRDMLEDHKDKPVLMYCTGGIRCEKASAYLKANGFNNVNQLHGGIINYAHEIEKAGKSSKFIGKNFVFDDRLGERITEDVISNCHTCGEKCDEHTNCKNDDCHLLFIQCKSCSEKLDGCCSVECQEIAALPLEEQKKLRKDKELREGRPTHKSRLRPKPNKLSAQ
ncbi:MAG: rhodanese-related sulfurtransferase [Lentisphaeria bacterium]|nr:rhodanese-related sulfurtransferase [Lentisphaeria bacterium]